jgi:hypothetical protein
MQSTEEYRGSTDEQDDADLQPDNEGRGSVAWQRSKEMCAKVNGTKPPPRSPELWDYMREAEVARAKAVKVPLPRPGNQTNYRLPDGSEAHVQPDGKVISGISGVAMRQEPDETGKLVTYYSDGPTEERQQQHRAAVMTFMRSRTYRREVRRLRPRPHPARRPHAHARARRERRHVARATSSSDPGEPPPPPAWLPCPACGQPLVEDVDTGNAHCGGCISTYWGAAA